LGDAFGHLGSLVARLATRFRVHAVDLPAMATARSPRRSRWIAHRAAVSSSVPADAGPLTVVGWSLGGLVAMRWARQEPARVGRLALVATTPRFAAGSRLAARRVGADALPASATSCTSRGRSRSSASSALQLQGSEHGRCDARGDAASRYSRAASRRPKRSSGALDAIVTTDLRAEVPDVAQPALVIAGGRDTLALPAAARWLSERLPDARFCAIDGAAHVPFLSHPDAFATALDSFPRWPLTRATPIRARPIRAAVRRHFARAAATYDDAAVLQKEIGARLAERLDAVKLAPASILDAGCGTGDAQAELGARYPHARYVGFDLALPMAAAARAKAGARRSALARIFASFTRRTRGERARLRVRRHRGDAVCAGTFDLVWSNLALQWIGDLPAALAEINPGARGRWSRDVHDVRPRHAEGAPERVRRRSTAMCT
jgi:pimeloyl-ACP methyl ester carboxylesterase